MDESAVGKVLLARDQRSDEARPGAAASVHAAGRLTARERIEALLDPGSAVEYGVIAGHTAEPREWIPSTGGVDFVGTVDGQAVVTSSTDFTDHGGGYGAGRLTRLLQLAHEHRWPVVGFFDGGGSRAQVPGRKRTAAASLDGPIGRFGLFDGMAELSGWVPTVAIVSGPSFAGHASLAGFSDVVFTTRGSSIGMGGPPLVEAALGVRLRPEELAPVEMHELRGGIDLLVNNEHEAIAAVRRYLAYLRDLPEGTASGTADSIEAIVSESGPYDMHEVIAAIVDAESTFELRAKFATSLITALARIGGKTVGILANQPAVFDGAIDPAAADKISRFVELCDAYGYPMLSLIDTPGFVRGAQIDDEPARPGLSRHHMRPLMAHHHRTVPLFSVQIGRGSALGAFAMTGYGDGRSIAPLRLAWPSVSLVADDGFTNSVHARNAFDDVVTPTETRAKILAVLRLIERPAPDPAKRHTIDTW